MAVEVVNLEYIDEPFYDNSLKEIRNLDMRLRVTDNFAFDGELQKKYQQFFALLGKGADLSSDTLLAAAQKMFEIEQHKTVSKYVLKNIFKSYNDYTGYFHSEYGVTKIPGITMTEIKGHIKKGYLNASDYKIKAIQSVLQMMDYGDMLVIDSELHGVIKSGKEKLAGSKYGVTANPFDNPFKIKTGNNS